MTFPMYVRVSFLGSAGVSTEADLTVKVRPPILGMLIEEPKVGHRLVVWRGGKRVLASTYIARVEVGAGTWKVETRNSRYRVGRLHAAEDPCNAT